MRPAQQHRVLKQALSNQDQVPGGAQIHHQRPMLNPHNLTPLMQNMNLAGNPSSILNHHAHPNLQNKLTPFHHQNKLGLAGQLPRIDNGSDKEQINNLQQRVKELEKENFKLQHHVQQAEQSIRNYREILQAHNITNLTPPSVAKENKVNTKSQPSIPSISELPIVTKPSIDVEALKHQHQLEMRLIRESADKANREQDKIIQAIRVENECSKKLIADLREEFKILEDSAKKEKESLEKRLSEKEQLLINKLMEHDQLHKLQKQLQDQLQQALSAQQAKIKTPSPKKKQAKISPQELGLYFRNLSNECCQLKSNSTKMKVTVTEDLAALQHFCYQSVQLVTRRCKELLQHKELEMERLKIDHDTSVISYMEQIEDLSSQLIAAQGMRLQSSYSRQDIGCSPMKNLFESPTKQLRLQADHDMSQAQVEQLKKQLEDACLQVQSLQDVHGAEIKAVKHVAHIKELLRVAKEREQSLDRDRLQIELKHLKEVLNVLTFSLNTAEQSLVELQPQVVTKLIEGRNRRIQMLEQSYKGKLKDVEQRSAETCAVNSQHLEQFQKKAAENEKNAQNITKSTAEELIRLLQVSL